MGEKGKKSLMFGVQKFKVLSIFASQNEEIDFLPH